MAQRAALECLSTRSRRVLGHVLSPSTRQEIHLITCEAEDWMWGVDRELYPARPFGSSRSPSLSILTSWLDLFVWLSLCLWRSLSFPRPLCPSSFYFISMSPASTFLAFCASLALTLSLSPSTTCVILSVKLNFQSDSVSHFFFFYLCFFSLLSSVLFFFCSEHRGH